MYTTLIFLLDLPADMLRKCGPLEGFHSIMILMNTRTQEHMNTLGHSNLITCLTSFFWKKNPVRLKKKEKKGTFGVLRTKVVLKFSVRLQKKKKCKF